VLPNLIALAYVSFHYIDSATTGSEETQKGQESQILSIIVPTFFFERMGIHCAYFIDIEEIYKPGFDRTTVKITRVLLAVQDPSPLRLPTSRSRF
jgi:hypothetical protein